MRKKSNDTEGSAVNLQEAVSEDHVETVETESIRNVESVLDKETKDEKSQNLPDYAEKLLKLYPHYDALYIDKLGGVYPKDAQPEFVQGAILYQNPYYKQ